MAWIKGQLLTGRIKSKRGIDFTPFGRTGNDIKFHSGAYLGSNTGTTGEWEKGIKITETLTEGTSSGGEYKGKYGRGLEVVIDTTSEQDGHPQGGVYITFDRDTAYGHSGGSADCGLRVISSNYATCASGGARGMDILAYCRGAQGNVTGALITARVRSSGSFTGASYGARVVTKCQSNTASSGTLHALEVADESDGVVPSGNSIVYIEKHSNSYTAATRAGIEIVNNSNASYAKVITYALYLKGGASASQNITYVAGFDSNDGDDGFTKLTGTPTQGGTIIGYLKLYNAADSAVLYIPAYSQAAA